MSPFGGLTSAWRWAVRKILARWVKTTVKPDDGAATLATSARPVCYVLENDSHTDLAVLNNVCAELKIPPPERCFALVRQTLFPPWRTRLRAPRYLVLLV